MSEHEKHDEHEGGGHGGGGAGGHGAAHEEHEGAPEWLISFADNVALLMGFFAILLAMNMKEPTTGGIGGREQQGGAPQLDRLDFVIAMREGFNNPVNLNSSDPKDAPLRDRIRQRQAERDAGRAQQPAEHGEAKEAQAKPPTELSSLGGTVPFEDGSETLTATGRELASRIAEKLKGQRWMIDIRGHASPTEAPRDAERAFALSQARAMAVARVLAGQGVEWSQMRIVGCGINERRAGRAYGEADRINQRVEVIPSNDPTPEPGGPEASATGGRDPG